MKAKAYWAVRHIRQRAWDFRFATTCWWLSQRVDFLEWLWRLDALIPQVQPVRTQIPTTQRSRYAVRAL
ncbi:hypothetical protein [Petrachloros mirabilis]